jgi:uncharacterized radical SAM superfamily Fe-S cluster-containing enzyme
MQFKHSKKESEIRLGALVQSAVEFLENYGTDRFIGKEFSRIIGEGNGKTKFAALLGACGCDNDPERFFMAVLEGVGSAKGRDLRINGVPLPDMLLVSLLEQVIPGNGYVSIRDTEQLERETNLDIPDDQRADLQEVIEKYPVRLSRHTIRQMMVSDHVAYQYMPFVEELDPAGFVNTWIGQFHEGLLERMYENRVIFLLNMSCPVYCRFCFRKHKDSRNEKNPTPADVNAAIDHVRNSPTIKEIVITGGDPFLNRENMETAIDGLAKVDHVQTLRLATHPCPIIRISF